jgi:hypothetical protein
MAHAPFGEQVAHAPFGEQGLHNFFELSEIPIKQEKQHRPLQQRFPLSFFPYPPIFTVEHHCAHTDVPGGV